MALTSVVCEFQSLNSVVGDVCEEVPVKNSHLMYTRSLIYHSITAVQQAECTVYMHILAQIDLGLVSQPGRQKGRETLYKAVFTMQLFYHNQLFQVSPSGRNIVIINVTFYSCVSRMDAREMLLFLRNGTLKQLF